MLATGAMGHTPLQSSKHLLRSCCLAQEMLTFLPAGTHYYTPIQMPQSVWEPDLEQEVFKADSQTFSSVEPHTNYS